MTTSYDDTEPVSVPEAPTNYRDGSGLRPTDREMVKMVGEYVRAFGFGRDHGDNSHIGQAFIAALRADCEDHGRTFSWDSAMSGVETWVVHQLPEADDETKAIHQCLSSLACMNADGRARVVAYLTARFPDQVL